MSVEAWLRSAKMKCTCCRAPVVGDRPECDCWKETTDRCNAEKGFGCVNHCACELCGQFRGPGGLRRINWTGRHHLYWDGDERTVCGRRIPSVKNEHWPFIRVARVPRETDCKRCSVKTSELFGGEWARVPHGGAMRTYRCQHVISKEGAD